MMPVRGGRKMAVLEWRTGVYRFLTYRLPEGNP
jgi:hypothetical protein